MLMLTSKVFECNYCGKTFNKSQGLSRHKKTAKFCLKKREDDYLECEIVKATTVKIFNLQRYTL